MPIFCGTFGHGHKHYHVHSKVDVRNFYTLIYAPDMSRAMSLMWGKYNKSWANIYEYKEFDRKKFAPKGKLDTLGIRTPEDEAEELIQRIYEQRRHNREAEGVRDSNNELLP